MKNKGRKHLTTSVNCKGYSCGITRLIESMGSANQFKQHSDSNKKMQRWWNKRVRGYLKTQKGQEIFN